MSAARPPEMPEMPEMPKRPKNALASATHQFEQGHSDARC